MLNPLNLISKFFGSSNKKELNKIQKIVSKINFLEEKNSKLSNEDFPNKTEELIKKNKYRNFIRRYSTRSFCLGKRSIE